jgi:hypothetical protein
LFRLEQTRPLTYFTFWLNQSFGGWHVFNLCGHLLALWLVDRIARRLLPPELAPTAALLFAVHPLLSEPVQYLFARSSLRATLFCLAALDAWTRQRHWSAVAWFLPALLAKEECVAFPVALLLLRPVWPPMAAMVALSAAAGGRVLYATKTVAGAGSGFDAGFSPGEYLLSQGQVVWGYLLRIVVPYGLTLDPPAPAVNFEAGVLGWVLLGVAAGVGLWRGHPAGRWFVFGLILLLPSSSFLPAADLVAWRRLYLPMTAFSLAAAWVLPRRALLPVLALFTVLSAARAAEALALLAEAEQIAPGDPAIASHRGRAYLQQGQAARALAEFGRALAQRPDDPKAILNRGVALEALGQVEAARVDYLRALDRDPCQPQARQNLQRLGHPLPPCAPTN